MKTFLLAGVAVATLLAGIPTNASTQVAPPGMENRAATLDQDGSDSLPPDLQGRSLEDYGNEGQVAADPAAEAQAGQANGAMADDSADKALDDKIDK